MVRRFLHRLRGGERRSPTRFKSWKPASFRKKEGDDAWNEAARILETLPIEFHAATRALEDRAAIFKAAHRLSLADAFAATLAKEKKAELVTGDPEFKKLEKDVKVHWLPRSAFETREEAEGTSIDDV